MKKLFKWETSHEWCGGDNSGLLFGYEAEIEIIVSEMSYNYYLDEVGDEQATQEGFDIEDNPPYYGSYEEYTIGDDPDFEEFQQDAIKEFLDAQI